MNYTITLGSIAEIVSITGTACTIKTTNSVGTCGISTTVVRTDGAFVNVYKSILCR